jgi:hypothetical protein
MNWIQKQFYALYESDLPSRVTIEGHEYRRVKTFKYDFFAGTGIYESIDSADELNAPSTHRQIVVKIYRYRRFFGLPMKWLGKISVGHESRLYKLLQDIPGIPHFVGMVGSTGFAHEFIPGGPLAKKIVLSDEYFDQFHTLLTAIHQRGVAYVDLNKPENVLRGDDGKPYLLDFQISFAPNNLWPPLRKIANPILRQLQIEDWYHFGKHKRHFRPDLMTPEDLIRSYQRSLPIRIHRIVAMPYFAIRHFVMDLLNLKSVE